MYGCLFKKIRKYVELYTHELAESYKKNIPEDIK